MGHALGLLLAGPVTDKESGDGWSKEAGLVWGLSCMQGWRDRMEDAHLAVPSIRTFGPHASGWERTAVFGVMDGHGGEQVAHFCQRHILTEIARCPAEDCPAALSTAFHRMDEMLFDPNNLEELQSLSNDTSQASNSYYVNPECMGCTAVMCCIRRDVIVVANAGDSRAVLCRDGKAIDMSEDHKPNLPQELARIQQAGGRIQEQHVGASICYRVNGNLNLSRSIGDLAYKQNKQLAAKDQMICCTPDVRTFKRQLGDEFIVIACDGVWDVLSSQEVVDYVRPRLGSLVDLEQRLDVNEFRLSTVVEGLLDHCLSPDLRQTLGIGGDNMTCVVIAFVGMPHQELVEDTWMDSADYTTRRSSWFCPYR